MIFLFHKIFRLHLLAQIDMDQTDGAVVSPFIFNETLVVQQLVVTDSADFFILFLFGFHIRDLDLKLRPALFGSQSSHVAVAASHVSW